MVLGKRIQLIQQVLPCLCKEFENFQFDLFVGYYFSDFFFLHSQIQSVCDHVNLKVVDALIDFCDLMQSALIWQ